MITSLLLQQVTNMLNDFNGRASQYDLHLDHNSYLSAAFSYMFEMNHFLPILDGLVPIVIARFTYFGGNAAWKVAMWVINVLRGAGA